MSEPTFLEHLNADLPAETGDTEPSTPAPSPAPVTDTSDTTAPADTAPDATGDEEPLWNREEFLRDHPELAPLAKQLQGDYTRKMQAIAEQRKALEGLDQGTLDWARRFNEAVQYSPAVAQAMLQEVQQQLMGTSAPTPDAQEDDDPWVTDTERQLDQRLRQAERLLEEQKIANIRSEVDRQFAALSTELKVEIPYEQRVATIQAMSQANVPYTQAGLYWKALYGFEQAMNRGRDEGARVAATKAAIGSAPSSLVSPPAAEPEAKSHAEHLERAFGRV